MNGTLGHIVNGANDINTTNGADGTNGTIGTNGTSKSTNMLWQHPSPKSTPLWHFLQHVNNRYRLQLKNYDELHQWSVHHIADFWGTVWNYVGVRAERQASKVLSHLLYFLAT